LKELIVDTHILLWWLSNDARLSQTARDLISDPENVIYVSAASIWEAAIKRKLGKLAFEDALLFEVLLNGDWQVLSMTIQHALIAANLPPPSPRSI
jgi:PIN domain nuclease of toxin-antitoxin system